MTNWNRQPSWHDDEIRADKLISNGQRFPSARLTLHSSSSLWQKRYIPQTHESRWGPWSHWNIPPAPSGVNIQSQLALPLLLLGYAGGSWMMAARRHVPPPCLIMSTEWVLLVLSVYSLSLSDHTAVLNKMETAFEWWLADLELSHSTSLLARLSTFLICSSICTMEASQQVEEPLHVNVYSSKPACTKLLCSWFTGNLSTRFTVLTSVNKLVANLDQVWMCNATGCALIHTHSRVQHRPCQSPKASRLFSTLAASAHPKSHRIQICNNIDVSIIIYPQAIELVQVQGPRSSDPNTDDKLFPAWCAGRGFRLPWNAHPCSHDMTSDCLLGNVRPRSALFSR